MAFSDNNVSDGNVTMESHRFWVFETQNNGLSQGRGIKGLMLRTSNSRALGWWATGEKRRELERRMEVGDKGEPATLKETIRAGREKLRLEGHRSRNFLFSALNFLVRQQLRIGCSFGGTVTPSFRNDHQNPIAHSTTQYFCRAVEMTFYPSLM